MVRAAALPFFSFFLGLNQAARWGINETIRRWLSLALLVPGFYLGALRGACMGLFLSELGILLIGIWWSRPYLSRSSVRLDLPSVIPYLRFGLIFFTTHLLISTFQRSGEVMIRSFHGDYTEVGYFSLAYNVYLAIAMIIPQITLSFVPLSTTLLTRGEIHTLKGWMDQLLKWLGAGSMWVVFGVILLGKDLVPLVLGAAYEPVAADLVPLSLGLLSLILNSIATLLTMVYNQPKVGLIAAGIRLIVFWAFGVPLVARWGSLGACIAVLVSSAIYAGYFTWRMQKTIAYSLSKWALVIVLASLFLPLALLRSTWLINIALYGVFTAGYVSLLFLSRLMTWAEILLLWRTILPGSKKTQQVEI
ncbi:MAG: hypothetical protein FJY85_22720, partial [Deltaproteobacteria bacterium]|nr:hypothetical protein [Deltaproteobacteria bacterium]